ncbi:unnamed protein product [Lupinus luteus]|uniref:Uncharacterized protein n=1 Tax=Lupinus luteus TaxID=3873 RepID=A0AAV1X154_LUPLU
MRQARSRLPNKKKIDKGSPNGNPRYNPTRRIHYKTSKTSRKPILSLRRAYGISLESVQPLLVIWKGSSLASSILGHMSSSSSPFFGFGWERPGGAVDAESFPKPGE